jgi:hypothetical protein
MRMFEIVDSLLHMHCNRLNGDNQDEATSRCFAYQTLIELEKKKVIILDLKNWPASGRLHKFSRMIKGCSLGLQREELLAASLFEALLEDLQQAFEFYVGDLFGFVRVLSALFFPLFVFNEKEEVFYFHYVPAVESAFSCEA